MPESEKPGSGIKTPKYCERNLARGSGDFEKVAYRVNEYGGGPQGPPPYSKPCWYPDRPIQPAAGSGSWVGAHL